MGYRSDEDYDRRRRRRHRSRSGSASREHRHKRRGEAHRGSPSRRDQNGRDNRRSMSSDRPRRDRERTRHRRRSRSRSPRRHHRRDDSYDRPSPKQLRSHDKPASPSPESPAEIAPAPPKQTPNFKPTGALAAETNTVGDTTVVLKYNEPPEARKPPARQAWRLYVFKPVDAATASAAAAAAAAAGSEGGGGAELLDTVELAERSCWLFGREKLVADFPVEHPSCSKQHGVIQFRYVTKTNEWGEKEGRVRPYIIDLESANGTKVNGATVEPTRYMELRDGDLIQFGLSTREYVLMLPKD